MSERSRGRMRWAFAGLPWEMLGERLVMLSLTYPGDWRRWVPDGDTFERHRRSFVERWRREWGAPMGVWVKEFQKSGRPHLHLYIAVPDVVASEDYEGFRRRTLLRKRLEATYGCYEGRRRLPVIGKDYGGQFAMWLRTAWSEVVGTQGHDQRHHARGVDVSVSFWTDDVAATQDRVTVATYLAGESAKVAQKRPPAGFEGVGRYWGILGRPLGFKAEATETEVDPAVAYELERRLVRLVRVRMIAQRRKYGFTGPLGFDERRLGNGVMALNMRPAQVERLLRWCEDAAARKNARRRAAGLPEMKAYGPATFGVPADEIPRIKAAELDTDEGNRCGCGPGQVCEECITDEQVWQINAFGCICEGRNWCERCFDPEIHLSPRQRAASDRWVAKLRE